MNTSTATHYDVTLKAIEPVRVVSIIGVVPDIEQMGDAFDSLFGTLEEYVEQNGRAVGPHMAIYHDAGTGPKMLEMHVELAIPFEGDAPTDALVSVYDMPGADEMACVVHTGPFEEIGLAYDALYAWVADNGYSPAGPMRDVYMSCGDGDSAKYMTEVQVPVAR